MKALELLYEVEIPHELQFRVHVPHVQAYVHDQNGESKSAPTLHDTNLFSPMMVLKKCWSLLVSRHLEPNIRIIHSHSSIGGEARIGRWHLFVMAHLLELFIFIHFLHF